MLRNIKTEKMLWAMMARVKMNIFFKVTYFEKVSNFEKVTVFSFFYLPNFPLSSTVHMHLEENLIMFIC